MFKKIFLFSLGLCFAALVFFNVQPALAENVDLYFFYSDDCPHCQDEKAHLEYLQGQHAELNVHSHELSSSEDQQLLQDMAAGYGAKTGTVPITFIGEDVVYGAQLDSITSKVESCIDNICIDPMVRVGQGTTLETSSDGNTDGSNNQTFTIIAIVAVVAVVFIFLIVILKK